MKFFHISDLHLGKKVLKQSLIEDQVYILNQIIEYIRMEEPDAVMIAGDIYDKSIPSAEAVGVFDDFLSTLTEIGVHIFIISGNHDSGERLFFGKRIFEKSNVHIGAVYRGSLETVVMEDEYGEINVHMLPFIKPAMVQPFFENELESYEEAVKQVLDNENIDFTKRNIMIAHQYVTWRGEKPLPSDSEQISLGGIDQVDASLFDKFDYTALGHIHRPQKIGDVNIRYAGSPLKYSFSEVDHKKAVTCVEIGKKHDVNIRKLPLLPKTDMVHLKDELEVLLSEKYEEYRSGYYLSVTITDEEALDDPVGRLRAKFEGVLEVHIERTRKLLAEQGVLTSREMIKKTPLELFADFYKKQNDTEMNTQEEHIIKKLMQ